MAKFWLTCTMVVAVVGSLSVFGMAQEQPSVTGEWRASYQGIGGESLSFWLTLKQDGEKVTGTYLNDSIRPPINRPITGTFKDGVLVYGNTRAVVTGDTMKGTFPATAGAMREFTATKTK